jgi:hypothetical protein
MFINFTATEVYLDYTYIQVSKNWTVTFSHKAAFTVTHSKPKRLEKKLTTSQKLKTK